MTNGHLDRFPCHQHRPLLGLAGNRFNRHRRRDRPDRLIWRGETHVVLAVSDE